MTGIDDDWQVGELLDQRHRGEIEGEAGGGIESPNAALTEDDVRIALGQDVLRAHQPLLDGGGEPALQQDRLVDLAYPSQEGEVGHVAGADLQHVGVMSDEADLVGLHDLGDDRQPGQLSGLAQVAETLLTQSLEGVGRGAWFEGPAPQQVGAGGFHRAGRFEQALAALDDAGTADEDGTTCSDRYAANVDDGSALAALTTGQHVGTVFLEDGLHAGQVRDRHGAGYADDRSALLAGERASF